MTKFVSTDGQGQDRFARCRLRHDAGGVDNTAAQDHAYGVVLRSLLTRCPARIPLFSPQPSSLPGEVLVAGFFRFRGTTNGAALSSTSDYGTVLSGEGTRGIFGGAWRMAYCAKVVPDPIEYEVRLSNPTFDSVLRCCKDSPTSDLFSDRLLIQKPYTSS